MAGLNLDRNETLPQWNYDIRPRDTPAPAASDASPAA